MSDELEEAAAVPMPMPAPVPSTPNCPGGQTYTVQSGDTMFLIAQRFGIPLQSLIDANPQVTNPNLIYPGQSLCVPMVASGGGGGCAPGMTTYTVVRGDTLFAIAQRYGVSLDALIRANPQITNPDLIYPGQVVCIPVSVGPPQCTNGFLYTVVQGDTLYKIAQRFGITLDMLIRANPQITNPDLIMPNQVICVPFPMPPSTCAGRLYTVKSGDTLTSISRMTGVPVDAIMAANPQIVDANRIFAGQVICIPAIAVPAPIPTPLPIPMPLPSPGPTPSPAPLPIPLPAPVPMPMPMPMPPCQQPIPMPMPMPLPIQGMPCQPPMMMPMPYENCPYRSICCCKKRHHKRHHHKKCSEGYKPKKQKKQRCGYPMPM